MRRKHFKKYKRKTIGMRRPKYKRKKRLRNIFIGVVILLIVAAFAFALIWGLTGREQPPEDQTPINTGEKPIVSETPEATPTPTPTPSPSPTTEQVDISMPENDKTIQKVEANTITGEIMSQGQQVDTFEREDPIQPDGTSELEGILTYRQNDMRNSNLSSQLTVSGNMNFSTAFEAALENNIAVDRNFEFAPLVVSWDSQTISHMNVTDEIKERGSLTEIIFAGSDGLIYFFDAQSGQASREAIDVGVPFLCTPTLDPRGYPILYIGQSAGPSGVGSNEEIYMRAYSLVDGRRLMRVGADERDEFALNAIQGNSGAPIVNAASDTLIWASQNGIIYTVKLNTSYNEQTGQVSMDPDRTVKYRYQVANAGAKNFSIKLSPSLYDHYLFFVDETSRLHCIDLNTMELMYAVKLQADASAAPLIYETETGLYVYTATEAVEKEGGSFAATLTLHNGTNGETIASVDIPLQEGDSIKSIALGDSNVIVNTVGETSSILSFRKDNLEAQGSTPLEGTTYGDIQLLTDSSGTSYIAVITQEGTLSLLDENGSVVKEQNVGNNVLSAPVFWKSQLYFVTDTQLIGLQVS